MSAALLRKAWPAGWLLLATTMLVPTAARAQAWLPGPGRGSIFLGYEYAQARWTLMPNDVTGKTFATYTGGPDNKLFEGDHYGHFETADLDYGIRKGLAVTAHLAYVASEYTGRSRHRDQNGRLVLVDDGNYHGSLQDAEVGVHQTVLSTPFVATPFVAYLLPLQPYSDFGHGAVGHHLREVRIGAALARDLRPLLPDAYGQVTYGYSAAERQDDHSIHRNRVDMELGYFVTSALSLKGAASWTRSSGGIEWYRTSSEFLQHRVMHDALANERSWRVGGSAGYALTPRYNLYMAGFATVSGANTHATSTFASGVGWNFATPWAR